MEASIPQIVKEIDCIQETQQHSIVIEHNWSIRDICELIRVKRPGEKIESEQFSYTPSKQINKTNNKKFSSSLIELNDKPINQSTQSSNCKQCCNAFGKENHTNAYLSKHSILPIPLSLNVDILYDFFLLNSKWRLEINKSSNDLDFISVNAILLSSNRPAPNNEHLCKILKLAQTHEKQLKLKLKISFYLLNCEMNELYEHHSVEANLDLKKFINLFVSANLKANRKAKSIEKFKIDKFCKIKELLCWLNERKSDDFCLLAEFKMFAQLESDSNHSTIQSCSRLKQSKLGSSLSSVDATKSSHLLFNFKHAWVIKNWRNFLMPGSACHTFMSDADITNIFSAKSRSSQNCTIDQPEVPEPTQTQLNTIKFGKFRSKLFSLVSNQDQSDRKCEAHSNEFLSKNKIESLLKDVKWKLQLYPNGYNTQYGQNLSLFVNFSQLTDQLAPFSSSLTKKSSTPSAKLIEETFYDSSDSLGLILLIKSPSSLSNLSDNNQNLEFEEFDDLSLNDLKTSRKKHANCETFVKASFQIAILDSKGKKVDKCQSEKQLFELFGSWGYKEYMNVKDLYDFKEKYLTNECLNLNCKIVLFYTLTSKFYPDLLKQNLSSSPSVSLPKSYSCSKISNDVQATPTANLNLLSLEMSKVLDDSDKPETRDVTVKSSTSLECNSLLYDLRRLLINANMFDLIVQAPICLDSKKNNNNKQFKAHKLILSIRSDVFERMFNNKHADSMQTEKNKTTSGVDLLEIVDFDALTVEIFLNYLYTDKMEVNVSHLVDLGDIAEENEVESDPKEVEADAYVEEADSNGGNQVVYENLIKQKKYSQSKKRSSKYLNDELRTALFIELFKMADKYCVYRLKNICELQLLELVSCETLVELLVLAYLHSSLKLKRVCFDYLIDNVSSIISQPNWTHLEKHYPSILAEAFRVLYLTKKNSSQIIN
jgi:hypothetical protein